MNKKDFERIRAGVKEMVDIELGNRKPKVVHEVAVPDAKKIRANTGLSQAQFAKKYGLEKKTLQHWEHGTRNPVGPAATLLKVIASHPKAVEESVACPVAEEM